MAKLGSGGDLSGVRDDDMYREGGWKAMEPGWYRFVCKESAYKSTSRGDGMCLHLHHICLDPQYHGQEKRDFLTLEHPNPETVRIAKAKLKELAVAVGHPTPDAVTDSDELLRLPFMAQVYVEKAPDPKYGDIDGNQNKIGGYRSCQDPKFANGGKATAPAPEASGSDEPPPPGDGDIPF
jgi:hypothetical protein